MASVARRDIFNVTARISLAISADGKDTSQDFAMILLRSFCCGQAAEVEKHERLRALASARKPILSLVASRESSGGTVTRETTSLHKDVRGPWDGLGVHRRDMVPYEGQHIDQTEIERSQDAASLLNSRKRLAPCSVQTVMSRRLKSVDVKPDIASERNVASSIGSAKEGESTSTSQWEGLVGYSSEGSEDN